jgi:hypothetical protein
VQQRDNEIGILLNYLNKKKGSGGDDSGMPMGVPVSRAIANEETKTTEESTPSSGLVKGQTLF